MIKPANVLPVESRDMIVLFTVAKGRTLAVMLEDALDYDHSTLLRSLWRLRKKGLIERERLGKVPEMKHRGVMPFEYWITAKGRVTLRGIFRLISKLAKEAPGVIV